MTDSIESIKDSPPAGRDIDADLVLTEWGRRRRSSRWSIGLGIGRTPLSRALAAMKYIHCPMCAHGRKPGYVAGKELPGRWRRCPNRCDAGWIDPTKQPSRTNPAFIHEPGPRTGQEDQEPAIFVEIDSLIQGLGPVHRVAAVVAYVRNAGWGKRYQCVFASAWLVDQGRNPIALRTYEAALRELRAWVIGLVNEKSSCTFAEKS